MKQIYCITQRIQIWAILNEEIHMMTRENLIAASSCLFKVDFFFCSEQGENGGGTETAAPKVISWAHRVLEVKTASWSARR